MMDDNGHMKTQQCCKRVHAGQPRMRLPSLLVASTRNLQRLLSTLVAPGMNVLAIGFATGKQLAYVAKILGHGCQVWTFQPMAICPRKSCSNNSVFLEPCIPKMSFSPHFQR